MKREVETIILPHDYWILIDNLNYTLMRKRIGITKRGDNKGQETEVEETIGYYANIRNCIKRMVELENISSPEVETLEEYANRIETSNSELVDVIMKGIS